MKKFTLIGVCVAAAGLMASAAVPMHTREAVKAAASAKKYAPNTQAVYKAAAETYDPAIWHAVNENVFSWDGSKWFAEEENVNKFDEQGNIIETRSYIPYDKEYNITTTTYNDYGKRLTKLQQIEKANGQLVNSSSEAWEYSEETPGLIVKHDNYIWLNNQWNNAGNVYKRNISRDAAGNITQSEVAVWFNGIYDPQDRITIEYTDGKATRIEHTTMDYNGFWVTVDLYEDIVWDRTDGQIWQTDQLYYGDNRIKSCKYTDKDEMEFAVKAEYFEGNDYKVEMVDDFTGYSVYREYTEYENDKNYDFNITEGYSDDFLGDLWLYTYQKVRTDKWGLATLEEAMATFGGDDGYEIQRSVGEVVYGENGEPTSWTVYQYYNDASEDTAEGEKGDPFMKVEMSNYVAVTGIDDIKAEDANAEAEYYNLQGIRVAQPESGNIYIRRQGGKVSKQIVR